MLWERLLKIEEIGDSIVVHFIAAKIRDAENIDAIQEKLVSLITRSAHSSFVFDLKDVEYLSSTALGIFMTLHKKIKAAGGQLVLRNLRFWQAEKQRLMIEFEQEEIWIMQHEGQRV